LTLAFHALRVKHQRLRVERDVQPGARCESIIQLSLLPPWL
jgi:hypothetical protein